MSGLPRRTFLATTAALSAAWALPTDLLGAALAAPLRPSSAPTTLLATVRQLATPVNKNYRTLVAAGGEPYLARIDITGKQPDPKRISSRRSLLYVGHFSDIHLIDAQSPARLEPLEAVAPAMMSDASRPQDTLTTQVLAQMVASVADARFSPLTGAPMAATFVTGDMADSHSSMELRWYIDILDGVSIMPNTGAPGVYDGVQVWPEATYVYHPENSEGDIFADYGFPTIPGYLKASVSQEVHSVGLPVPYYSVYGNHDTGFMGNIQVDSWIQTWATGPRKCSLPQATVEHMMVGGWVSESSAFQRFVYNLQTRFGSQPGIHDVPADPARKLFDQIGFMQAHLDTKPVPGPIGHGFTQQNIATGQTWWKTDVGPNFRFFGLDSCNQIAGADGAIPQDQFDWLKAELAQAHTDRKICVVTSHHNSYTLENTAVPTIGPSQNLIHGEQFIAMLQEFPHLIAWVNGHTHVNTITAHPKPGGGGFWEITTASCVDFPQQQQAIEFVDNRDGTLSIFTTVLDHKSPAVWNQGDFSQVGLASLSRQLASNDWYVDPLQRSGSLYDRNCELLIKAPFDMSQLSDAALEQAQAAQRARLVAYEQGARS